MSKTKAPEVVELSTAQLEELLAKLAQLLPAELYQLVEKLLRTLQSRTERLTWPSPSRCAMRFPAMSPRTFKPCFQQWIQAQIARSPQQHKQLRLLFSSVIPQAESFQSRTACPNPRGL